MKLLACLLFLSAPVCASEMLVVGAGTYRPILGDRKAIQVKSFLIDETAVSNQDYLRFVQKNPQWAKSKRVSLFADSNYLKSWDDLTGVVDKSLNSSPVVNVSWFAAKAYCESLGKRLPSVDEWEYLAQFGPTDSPKDVKSVILEWYSKPTPVKLPPVKSTFKNKFGVWDVHGLIWEWTYDFNTAFITGESRADSALEKSMFCGAGSVGSADPSDYAAFMRFAFRGSLRGNYTVENLGFRCTKDQPL